MRFIKLLLLIIVLILVVLFFMQNTDVLSQYIHLEFLIPGAQALGVDSLHWSLPPLPLYAVILIAFFIGAIFVLFSSLMTRLRLHSELRRANRKAREFEQEVNSLRKLPLQKNGQGAASAGQGSHNNQQTLAGHQSAQQGSSAPEAAK